MKLVLDVTIVLQLVWVACLVLAAVVAIVMVSVNTWDCSCQVQREVE